MSESQEGASWWKLSMFFVLSLLLFVAMRWQPEPWLRSHIDDLTLNNGIILKYENLQTEGFSARLDHVSVQVAGLPVPLTFDSLSIRPAWALLLSGSADIQLQLNWQGQQGEMLLSWQDDYIDIGNIEAELDMAVLQVLWQKYLSTPVNMIGRVRISGNLQLDIQSGRPLTGELNASGQFIGIMLGDDETPLGDYSLVVKTADTSGLWRWALSGGTALLLQGEGTLEVPVDVRQVWPVSGQARIEAGKEAGTLSAMLGAVPLEFSLSGHVTNPKLKLM